MLYTFMVASKAVPTIPVTLINVEAPGPRIGKRRARGVARVHYGFTKSPVSVINMITRQMVREQAEDRKAAVVIHRWAAEEARRRVTSANLDGIGTPFYRQREDTRYRRN